MPDEFENRRASQKQSTIPSIRRKVPVEFSEDATAFPKAMKQLVKIAARGQSAAPKLENPYGCPPSQYH
ncbi:MAG: hypothetical protein HYR88_04250 [Verrucomicrobia bacterium]|nr:hypothetical protein [Verrucomicrobiota bacterium]MBI3867073.1 hypothetical protein [Verrucomicrobiota bacterium]